MPVSPSLSIIVASSARRTLARTLESISPQLRPGDELLVDVNTDGDWGARARDRKIAVARGQLLLFIDDDDTYTSDALRHVRHAYEQAPGCLHVFRMRYPDGHELWDDPVLRCANVGTPMVAIPRAAFTGEQNTWTGPRWGQGYEGDFEFIAACATVLGEPIWHEQVIALLGRRQ